MISCIGCEAEFEREERRNDVRYKGNYCPDCEDDKEERVSDE